MLLAKWLRTGKEGIVERIVYWAMKGLYCVGYWKLL